MAARALATVALLWAVPHLAGARSLAPRADETAGPESLYVYDQRQNGTYNIQIHLKDVEVLALLSAAGEDYDDASYDQYSYEYHDPVEEEPEEVATNTTTAKTTTTTCQPTSSTTTAPTTTTTTTTTTRTRTGTGPRRRRCRPGYTRRPGGRCTRTTATGGRPLLQLPSPMGFFLRLFLHLFISGLGLVVGRDTGAAGLVSGWRNVTQIP